MNLKSTMALLTLAIAAPAPAATLSVTVDEIAVQQGQLKLALYDSESAWKGEAKPRAGHLAQPDGDATLEFSFADLPPGRYAVRVMHDENGNGKLDSNFLGIPKEGYGASNNPKVMRAPHFDEAAFDLGEEDLAITIILN
jgi:uncharacterized protein (DUF2141 family)